MKFHLILIGLVPDARPIKNANNLSEAIVEGRKQAQKAQSNNPVYSSFIVVAEQYQESLGEPSLLDDDK